MPSPSLVVTICHRYLLTGSPGLPAPIELRSRRRPRLPACCESGLLPADCAAAHLRLLRGGSFLLAASAGRHVVVLVLGRVRRTSLLLVARSDCFGCRWVPVVPMPDSGVNRSSLFRRIPSPRTPSSGSSAVRRPSRSCEARRSVVPLSLPASCVLDRRGRARVWLSRRQVPRDSCPAWAGSVRARRPRLVLLPGRLQLEVSYPCVRPLAPSPARLP